MPILYNKEDKAIEELPVALQRLEKKTRKDKNINLKKYKNKQTSLHIKNGREMHNDE